MYDAPPVAAVKQAAQSMLSTLFATYAADPVLLPERWRPERGDGQTVVRAVGDFVAGMTDGYAVGRYRDLVGPVALPEGF